MMNDIEAVSTVEYRLVAKLTARGVSDDDAAVWVGIFRAEVVERAVRSFDRSRRPIRNVGGWFLSMLRQQAAIAQRPRPRRWR